MDHSEAVELLAAEQYVLGELTNSQRDAFEEHFFECMECAAEVKAAASLVDNARAALRQSPMHEVVAGPRPAPSRGWLWWLRPGYALAAMALLLAVIGYQNLVTIPQARREVAANTAQALPTFSLAVTRGEANATEIAVRQNAPFGIYIDIPASDRFTSYTCELRTAEGSRKLSIDVSVSQAKDPVQLFIPGGKLASGRYDVVVLGKPANANGSEEVVRSSFVMKYLP